MTQGKDMMEDKGAAGTVAAANANVVAMPGARAKEIEPVPATSLLDAPATALPEALAQTEPAPAPAANKSRKKAKLFGIGVLVTLGGLVAWYPLSDHYAPFASGASITAQVTQIAPRVAGPVQHVLIADNAEVKAGQPLFQIDDTTFKMDVAQAQAQLDQALNSVSAGVAAIPAAEAKLAQAEVALLTAEQELDRTTQLHESGLVSVAKFNTADANHQTAQLNVAAAKAEVERIKLTANTNDGNNPNLRTAQAVLDKAEFALANTTVLAPADGYISNLSLAEGQFVAAGTPAMTFINPTTQMVIADLRENQLVNVQPGDRAVVTFEAAPGRQFDATVDSIAWGINSGRTTVNGLAQPSTDTRWFPPARKVPVRVTIDDMSALPQSVRFGSEASVLIIPDEGLIPAIARGLLSVSSVLSGFN